MKLLKCFILGILLSTPLLVYAAGQPAEYYVFAPPTHYPVLSHAATIKRLILCESGGANIRHLDSNKLYSYGILQIQNATWRGWEAEGAPKGDPMNRHDAMVMADWAIEHGYLHSWTCARILGMIR